MTPTIRDLGAAGLLAPLDVQFAVALGRIARLKASDPALLAAALASRRTAEGHVCLDLAGLAGRPVEGWTYPQLGTWRSALLSGRIAGGDDAATPLVLDDAGRLYLRRYREHERRLARMIHRRVVDFEECDPDLRSDLDRLFGEAPPGEADMQRVAAITALERRFTVISGGPGTGKTSTVIRIAALLAERAIRSGSPAPRILLLAPTGKAASRLVETIRAARASLSCSDAARLAIPDEAMTIHRALGASAGGARRFRRDEEHPLAADVVVVDEASMVDLTLMSRLIAAVPPASRVILLGDRDQLASVEAGAVLGDICNAQDGRGFSGRTAARIESILGRPLPSRSRTPRATGIWDSVVQLTRNYRFGESSGIGALARAINEGDASLALGILASRPDVSLAAPGRGIAGMAAEAYRPFIEAPDPVSRLRAFDSFRVLCALRQGRAGVERINRAVEAALRIDSGRDFYEGRPVLVTRNDYETRLMNGDVGVVVRSGSDLRAAFPDAGGIRLVSPSRLPPHETAFAMTIHKSQGSEFDEIAVVLPERDSPILTRELLYTAVSRARRRVVLFSGPDAIRLAASRRIERTSGLRDALWD